MNGERMAELLFGIGGRYPDAFTPKALAAWAGVGVRTASKWMNGESVMALSRWRQALAACPHAGIRRELFAGVMEGTGIVAVLHAPRDSDGVALGTPTNAIRSVAAAIDALAEAESDGRVTPDEAMQVQVHAHQAVQELLGFMARNESLAAGNRPRRAGGLRLVRDGSNGGGNPGGAA